jgi:hypothetical protein
MSYLAKLEALRWLYQGVQVLVVDPDGEYQRLADAVGGTTLALGAPGVHLNPLDLGGEPDALTRRALFCHTLLPVLLGQPLTAVESAALDRAAVAAYTSRGITSDPRTHSRPAPLLPTSPPPSRPTPTRPDRRWPPAWPPMSPGAPGARSSARPAPAPQPPAGLLPARAG